MRTNIFWALVAMFCTTGCQDTKKALGFTKSIPDENTVMERAPLTVPENLELRPPRAGDADAEFDAAAKAQQVLVGKTKASKDKSPLEKELLTKAGMGKTDPNIRDDLRKQPIKEDAKDSLDTSAYKPSEGSSADQNTKKSAPSKAE